MDIGLDVPQAARIADALRSRGLKLPDAIYTRDQLRDAILALKGEVRAC